MNEKLKWGLVAGAITGVASALPYLGAVNNVCCALYIGGGVLAAYLLTKDRPASPGKPYGEGALVGLLTGVSGGVVATFIAMLTGAYLEGAEGMREALVVAQQQGTPIPPEVIDMFDTSDGVGGAFAAVYLGTNVVLPAIAATIGGLVGVATFHKKDASAEGQ